MDADVLIVDDSAVVASTWGSILSSYGCRVETCASGEAGWRRLVAGANGEVSLPDVVLLDLKMPGLDGMTLLARIRADWQLAHLPVIIVTTEGEWNTRIEAMGAGADDYLCKPVEVSELLTRVERWSAG